ncbi:unnamed protein product [Durusdinium trenchii]|uniref:HECT-type E3 ubiquitin transferase n=1 Tax=Durusdinium trenchii TaxID=1381693 RepID=A0ABP0QQF7_9DINO
MEAVPVSGLTVLASGLRCLLRIQRLRAAHCNDVVIDGRRRSPGEGRPSSPMAPSPTWRSASADLSTAPSHVLSLGSRCFVAKTLETMNLRRYAGPFDWIYTTAQLVRHCIEDDFECFLDLEQLYRHGQAWGHRRYCQMLKRQILFPHHRPADRDREHFQRTVQRWRQVVASEEKKLFVFMPLVQSKKELQSVRDRESMHGSNLQQVEELLRSLRQRVGNFELLVVYVVEGSSRWRQGATEDTELDTTREILQQPELRVYELHCTGGCTGLKFKAPADDLALQSLLAARCSASGVLAPDPLAGSERRFHGSLRKSLGRRSLGKRILLPTREKRRKTSAVQDVETDVSSPPPEADPRLKKNFGRESSEPRRRAKNVEQLPSKGKRKAQADDADPKSEDDVILVSVGGATPAAPRVCQGSPGKPMGVLDIRVALRAVQKGSAWRVFVRRGNAEIVVYNNEHGIQIHFPLALFKMLKGESLSLADLQDVQPKVWMSIQQMLSWEPSDPAHANQEFEDTFCLTFSASYDYFGEMKHVDLKPGGGDLPVTYDTRKEYVELYCRWRLETSTERQFKLLAQGFEKVVDSALWSFLSAEEAHLIICSEPTLEASELRHLAHYEGYSKDDPYIQSFWKILESFETDQLKKFLAFTTGTDRAPLGGLKDVRLVAPEPQPGKMTGGTKRPSRDKWDWKG